MQYWRVTGRAASLRHMRHPQIPPGEASSVTHFLCPAGPTRAGQPEATHHLVPHRAGTRGGEPIWENTCTYCRETEIELRRTLGLG